MKFCLHHRGKEGSSTVALQISLSTKTNSSETNKRTDFMIQSGAMHLTCNSMYSWIVCNCISEDCNFKTTRPTLMHSLLNNLENKKGFLFGGCFSPMHLFAQNNYASMVELLVDLSCIWKNEEERYRKSFKQSNLAFTPFPSSWNDKLNNVWQKICGCWYRVPNVWIWKWSVLHKTHVLSKKHVLSLPTSKGLQRCYHQYPTRWAWNPHGSMIWCWIPITTTTHTILTIGKYHQTHI